MLIRPRLLSKQGFERERSVDKRNVKGKQIVEKKLILSSQNKIVLNTYFVQITDIVVALYNKEQGISRTLVLASNVFFVAVLLQINCNSYSCD
jgi:hypothetical protein